MMRDMLVNSDPLYKKYTAKDKRYVLKEFPYGWNQRFELECCMDSNINVKHITGIQFKSYTMCAYRELVYLGFPFALIKPILDPSFPESKVNILIKCLKRHFDITKLVDKDYNYIKNCYEKNK